MKNRFIEIGFQENKLLCFFSSRRSDVIRKIAYKVKTPMTLWLHFTQKFSTFSSLAQGPAGALKCGRRGKTGVPVGQNAAAPTESARELAHKAAPVKGATFRESPVPPSGGAKIIIEPQICKTYSQGSQYFIIAIMLSSNIFYEF